MGTWVIYSCFGQETGENIKIGGKKMLKGHYFQSYLNEREHTGQGVDQQCQTKAGTGKSHSWDMDVALAQRI